MAIPKGTLMAIFWTTVSYLVLSATIGKRRGTSSGELGGGHPPTPTPEMGGLGGCRWWELGASCGRRQRYPRASATGARPRSCPHGGQSPPGWATQLMALLAAIVQWGSPMAGTWGMTQKARTWGWVA